MEYENLQVLTDFISAWNWHLSGLFFLSLSIISLLIRRSIIWILGFAGVFVICEVVFMRRKAKIENEIRD